MNSNRYFVAAMVIVASQTGVCAAQTVFFPTDDAYVEENDADGVNNGAALNARTELDNDRNDVIYLRFDISEYSEPIGSATLNLTWFRDTNVDHLALLYYGLNESAQDEADWTELDLVYETAPGLIPDDQNTIEEFEDGHSLEETQDLDVDNITFLGRRDLLDFPDDDNIEGQTVSFTADDTVDFLKADSDGLVTLMVLRDWHTSGTQMRFASKEAIDLETILGDDVGQFSPSLVIDVASALPGDYNDDGFLDAADLDLQAIEVKKDPADQDLAKFDHNGDGVVNVGTAGMDMSRWGDRLIWIRTLYQTSVGDSNLDHAFDSGDLVEAFSARKYGTGEMAGWAEGDWNGDMVFDSGDLVFAFTDGGYVAAATPAAVPEPSSLALTLFGVFALAQLARRQR